MWQRHYQCDNIVIVVTTPLSVWRRHHLLQYHWAEEETALSNNRNDNNNKLFGNDKKTNSSFPQFPIYFTVYTLLPWCTDFLYAPCQAVYPVLFHSHGLWHPPPSPYTHKTIICFSKNWRPTCFKKSPPEWKAYLSCSPLLHQTIFLCFAVFLNIGQISVTFLPFSEPSHRPLFISPDFVGGRLLRENTLFSYFYRAQLSRSICFCFQW